MAERPGFQTLEDFRRARAWARTNEDGDPPDRTPRVRSLPETMAAPSTTAPPIPVIDRVQPAEEAPKIPVADTDLWVTTVDGRYQSPIIPIRVGESRETFYVHRSILVQEDFFSKALDGNFAEASSQSIDLPEEDPTVFSFVVSWLYEKEFKPIKNIESVLVREPEKGKGKAREYASSTHADASDSDASVTDVSAAARLRRIREMRNRRVQRESETRQKRGDRHRPDCTCNNCTAEQRGPPCWNCGMMRNRPPGAQPPGPRPRHPMERDPALPRGVGEARRALQDYLPQAEGVGMRVAPGGAQPPVAPATEDQERMSAEDLRTWLLTYQLSVEVYVCAQRYLLTSFKQCIADYIINQFEIVGMQAAHPDVLFACQTLHAGIPETDDLLKKIFARVGFMQARLWRNVPEETQQFFIENAEVAGLVMKETMQRREGEVGEQLPAMDGGGATVVPPRRNDYPPDRDRRRYPWEGNYGAGMFGGPQY